MPTQIDKSRQIRTHDFLDFVNRLAGGRSGGSPRITLRDRMGNVIGKVHLRAANTDVQIISIESVEQFQRVLGWLTDLLDKYEVTATIHAEPETRHLLSVAGFSSQSRTGDDTIMTRPPSKTRNEPMNTTRRIAEALEQIDNRKVLEEAENIHAIDDLLAASIAKARSLLARVGKLGDEALKKKAERLKRAADQLAKAVDNHCKTKDAECTEDEPKSENS